MNVVYFAQDLSDAAVARRVRMLRAGGADVRLLGFRRRDAPIHEVEGVTAIDLGQTFDGQLAARLAPVLRCSLGAGRWRDIIRGANTILARNLEMATIADAARVWAGSHVRLVYECLDIHGALLGGGVRSKLLRTWERRILRRSDALVVSSQGFLANYFETLGVDLPTTIVVENKRVLPESHINRPQSISDRGPPWKIGWFGIIRCVESFRILLDLARRRPELVDIEIRGHPTHELKSLIAQHLPLVNMRYEGAYTQADLASMYQSCHLTWAIDYWQRGHNSDWLLPNRLYEGGYYNRPAIALAGTQTARWLEKRGAGVVIQGDPDIEIDSFIVDLTTSRYCHLQCSTAAIPTDDLVHTVEDCRRIAAGITGNSLTASITSCPDPPFTIPTRGDT